MAVASLLPAFPIIGTGTTFNIANCLVPLAGIFFGPWVGAVVAGVGGFIGQLLAPHTVLFGPLQFTIAMLGALGAGFAMQRKWLVPLAIILLFGGVWYLLPNGRAAWATPLLYFLAAFIFIGWIITRKIRAFKNRGRMALAPLCCSGAGTRYVSRATCGQIFFQLPPAIRCNSCLRSRLSAGSCSRSS
jgi:hypothetical protein